MQNGAASGLSVCVCILSWPQEEEDPKEDHVANGLEFWVRGAIAVQHYLVWCSRLEHSALQVEVHQKRFL
jgi:hypothetical protein